MRHRPILIAVVAALACVGALRAAEKTNRKLSALEREARAFLGNRNWPVAAAHTVANQAAWIAATEVNPEHTAARAAAEKAAAAVTDPSWSSNGLGPTWPSRASCLSSLCASCASCNWPRAENPGTIPEVVSQRIEAEARQSAVLDGYTFCLQPLAGGKCGRPTSANEIDQILRTSRVLADRERAGWPLRRSAGHSSPACWSCKPCATRSRAPWATHRSLACRWRTTA